MNPSEVPEFSRHCRALLDEVRRTLNGVRPGGAHRDAVETLDRAVRAIGDSAKQHQCGGIVGFVDVMQDVLGMLRNGVLRFDENTIALLRSCGDHIEAQLESPAAFRRGEERALEGLRRAAGDAQLKDQPEKGTPR